MCPPGEPAQLHTRMLRIARLAKHIAIQHDDRVSSDNNTCWDFNASGMRLAPGQQCRVGGEGYWSERQCGDNARRRGAVTLLAVGAYSAEGNAEKTKQLTAARRSGGQDQRRRRSVHYNLSTKHKT